MPAPPQSKYWCFTLNNYTDGEYTSIIALSSEPKCTYLVFGKESGESNTPHLQGYIELSRKTRIGGVKTLLGSPRVHVEARRGTPKEAADYCKKEGDYFEYGTISNDRGEGHLRGRQLDAIKGLIDNGGSLNDVAEQNFAVYLQWRHGLKDYIQSKIPKRSWKSQVIWFWGKTGTGKTKEAWREANTLCDGNVCALADPTLVWYEPYAYHKAVIIDDFTGEAPIDKLLRIFDRYPIQVPVKGAFLEWIPRLIYVTSNQSPEEMYGHHHQWEALQRRLEEIREFV